MSIIQEALKKAQGEYFSKDTPSAAKEAVAVKDAVVSEEKISKPKTEVQMPQKMTIPVKMRVPAMLSILVILLIIYGLNVSLKYSSNVQRREVVAGATPTTTLPESLKSPRISPAGFMSTHASNLVLSGVMYIENRPQAIINGNVLQEGDKINGATILAIEKDSVLLDFNDTNVKLELSK